MLSVWQYVILCFVLFTVFGIFGYHWDRRYGVRLYRTWYNWTHRDPLPETEEKGFVHNQPAKKKFAALTMVSAIQSFLMIWKLDVNPLGELLMLFAEVPFAFLGFYLGPKIYPFWKKKDKLFTAIDDLENGKINLGEKIGQGIGKVEQAFEKLARETEIGSKEEAKSPTPPAAPKPNPYETIDKFVNKRR